MPQKATIDQSYQLVSLLAEVEQVPGPIELDASETMHFGPFGVALIASSIALRRSAGLTTTFKSPRRARARSFLDEISFDEFGCREISSSGTLGIRQMHALDGLYTEQVAALLEENVPGINKDNSYPMAWHGETFKKFD